MNMKQQAKNARNNRSAANMRLIECPETKRLVPPQVGIALKKHKRKHSLATVDLQVAR